jgi:hypothetical protein
VAEEVSGDSNRNGPEQCTHSVEEKEQERINTARTENEGGDGAQAIEESERQNNQKAMPMDMEEPSRVGMGSSAIWPDRASLEMAVI